MTTDGRWMRFKSDGLWRGPDRPGQVCEAAPAKNA